MGGCRLAHRVIDCIFHQFFKALLRFGVPLRLHAPTPVSKRLGRIVLIYLPAREMERPVSSARPPATKCWTAKRLNEPIEGRRTPASASVCRARRSGERGAEQFEGLLIQRARWDAASLVQNWLGQLRCLSLAMFGGRGRGSRRFT